MVDALQTSINQEYVLERRKEGKEKGKRKKEKKSNI